MPNNPEGGCHTTALREREKKISPLRKKSVDKARSLCYNQVRKGEGEATRENGQPHERR